MKNPGNNNKKLIRINFYILRTAVFPLFVFLFYISGLCEITAGKYPKWFLFPDNHCMIVTGFSWNEKGAFNDGLDKYYSYLSSSAKGDISAAMIKDWQLRTHDNIKFYFERDTTLEDSLTGIDTIFLDTRRVICIGNRECNINKENIKLDEVKKPKWIVHHPEAEDNRHYGVGSDSYAIYGRLNSWMIAERNALNDLVINYAGCINTMDKKYRNKLSRATKIKVNATVKNIQVIQRWASVEDKTCWVLIRGKIAEPTK